MGPLATRVVLALVGVAGAVLTTVGAFAHLDGLKAPGALAVTIGAGGLGIALALQGVELFPSRPRAPEDAERKR